MQSWRWCALTDGCDHRDSEVKGAGEFPLHAGFVRLQLQDHLLQLVKVLFGQVKRGEQIPPLPVQRIPLGHLRLGLQRVEDRRSRYQVGEGADDEGEGPHVLPLHGVSGASGGRADCLRGWRTESSAGSWLTLRGSLMTLWGQELFIQHHPSLPASLPPPLLPLQISSPPSFHPGTAQLMFSRQNIFLREIPQGKTRQLLPKKKKKKRGFAVDSWSYYFKLVVCLGSQTGSTTIYRVPFLCIPKCPHENF